MQEEGRERTEAETAGRAHLDERMLMEMLEEITGEKERLEKECREKEEEFQDLQKKYRDTYEQLQRTSGLNQSLQKKNRRWKWGMAAAVFLTLAGLGGTIYFFLEKNYYQDSYYDGQSQYSEAEAELKAVQEAYQQVQDACEELQGKYDKLSALEGLYGFGSENYYSDRGIVVLNEGETESINVHAEAGERYSLNVSSDGISCEWTEKAVSYLFGQLRRHPAMSDVGGEVIIEAKTAGAYTVSFKNTGNTDAFEVLVIVTGDTDGEAQETDNVLSELEKISDAIGNEIKNSGIKLQ